MVGDFNDTASMSERNGNGGSEMQIRCREFSNWIENNGFIDMGCSGPEHTWFQGNSPATFNSTRLDRGIINDEWRLRFVEGALRNLPRTASDHCPILISTTGFAQVPTTIKPFRFQAAWLHHEKFEEFVIQNWRNDVPIVQFLKLRRNRINTLQNSDGKWVADQSAVKSMVVEYWRSLFQDENREFTGYRLLLDQFPAIEAHKWSILTRPYADCEIKKGLDVYEGL
ncbi:uncharacterized protein LOC110731911 [Chenopodium quinoa]|uniref:uncharacterized protein LOC110731911 n=1 Tax=Chenopodium quinoa TaxID=63459 RepID=UPI000B78F581|nr:uncharacterized protein LOC110731911 [Chenopodium quinoa]